MELFGIMFRGGGNPAASPRRTAVLGPHSRTPTSQPAGIRFPGRSHQFSHAGGDIPPRSTAAAASADPSTTRCRVLVSVRRSPARRRCSSRPSRPIAVPAAVRGRHCVRTARPRLSRPRGGQQARRRRPRRTVRHPQPPCVGIPVGCVPRACQPLGMTRGWRWDGMPAMGDLRRRRNSLAVDFSTSAGSLAARSHPARMFNATTLRQVHVTQLNHLSAPPTIRDPRTEGPSLLLPPSRGRVPRLIAEHKAVDKLVGQDRADPVRQRLVVGRVPPLGAVGGVGRPGRGEEGGVGGGGAQGGQVGGGRAGGRGAGFLEMLPWRNRVDEQGSCCEEEGGEGDPPGEAVRSDFGAGWLRGRRNGAPRRRGTRQRRQPGETVRVQRPVRHPPRPRRLGVGVHPPGRVRGHLPGLPRGPPPRLARGAIAARRLLPRGRAPAAVRPAAVALPPGRPARLARDFLDGERHAGLFRAPQVLRLAPAAPPARGSAARPRAREPVRLAARTRRAVAGAFEPPKAASPACSLARLGHLFGTGTAGGTLRGANQRGGR
ncbi:hypothetical protein DFJ74DRAFT_733837 [Hyaloraphidium curvatum]|nr:hypothetical protein DFJ74DRAFT_733837 [Hyaloraphidium curvatum]